MGVDLYLGVIDFGRLSIERIRNYEKGFAELESGYSLDETSLLFLKSHRRSVNELNSILKADSDKVETLDMEEFYRDLNYFPFFSQDFKSFWLAKTSTLNQVKIPELLENESSKAAFLWAKMFGNFKSIKKSKFGENYVLKLSDKEIEFESVRKGGFIQGEELRGLKNELRPIVESNVDMYENLDEQYFERARRHRPIEFVYYLLNQTAIGDKSAFLTSNNP